MAEPSRGQDHVARTEALEAFIASIEQNVEAGLAKTGDLNEPGRLRTALGILIQNDRFRDAAALASAHPFDCKWVDLAIYANVALQDLSAARSLLAAAIDQCEDSVILRCRIAFAESAFVKVLGANRLVSFAAVELKADQQALLKTVLDVLAPIVQHVRLLQRIQDTTQNTAIEYTAHAYAMLGQLSQIGDLLNPLQRTRPIPLILAQLALARVFEAPNNITGRLRGEHPEGFGAHFLAALLDREIFDRRQESLESLIRLKKGVVDEGSDAVAALCEALFQTSSGIDPEAATRARDAVTELLGSPNDFELLFDAVTLLQQDKPDAALLLLESTRRQNDSAWWQLVAKANEALNNSETAMAALKRACDLLPHPEMLSQFAKLNIQREQYSEAAKALELARQQAPEDVRVLRPLAFTYVNLRRFKEAAVTFQKLTDLQPTDEIYRFNTAICLARSGSPEKALTYLDQPHDPANPNLHFVGVRCEILNSTGRAVDAFRLLEQVKDHFWNNSQFLNLLMSTAYRAGKDEVAQAAFQHLIEMQESGSAERRIFQAMSVDDVVDVFRQHQQQRDTMCTELLHGKVPWLFADALFGVPAVRSWHTRTQDARWISDYVQARAELTIYATNGVSAMVDPSGRKSLQRIHCPPPRTPVVADMSALLTLFRLGLLNDAIAYFGSLILPATYGDLAIKDANRLAPQQVSREDDLKTIHSAVSEERMLLLDDEAVTNGRIIRLDEYCDEMPAHVARLSDLRNALKRYQRLNSMELAELDTVCHRPANQSDEWHNSGKITVDLETLRTLARFSWFERLLTSTRLYLTRRDFETAAEELKDRGRTRKEFAECQEFWRTIELHSAFVEYRSCESIREFHKTKPDGFVPPVYFDSALLAAEFSIPLLADDRVCQNVALQRSPSNRFAAFGSDRWLAALAEEKESWETVASQMLMLFRWRYRFLIPEPQLMKVLADRSRANLPGPELREVAMYVQESLRDPGLFCGMEKTDPPISMALRLFMEMKESCITFLGLLWADQAYGDEQLEAVTRWSMRNLLPMIPRGMLYSPIGRRLGVFAPRAVLVAAMFAFVTIQPLERANRGLRLIADELGMTDDEFIAAGAEAADGKYD